MSLLLSYPQILPSKLFHSLYSSISLSFIVSLYILFSSLLNFSCLFHINCSQPCILLLFIYLFCYSLLFIYLWSSCSVSFILYLDPPIWSSFYPYWFLYSLPLFSPFNLLWLIFPNCLCSWFCFYSSPPWFLSSCYCSPSY